MQATTIHNLKKSKGLDPDKEVFSFGTGKGDMLQVIVKSWSVVIGLKNIIYKYNI
jgi:cyclopropane fatty-acyl-phospholipid synthase-like methyltransferase